MAIALFDFNSLKTFRMTLKKEEAKKLRLTEREEEERKSDKRIGWRTCRRPA